YAAFVCLAQVDLKRLIAYSSVGHMGFVLLGAGSLTVIGVQGAIFQLFNHGIITAILFMLAGSVKHSTGTRDIPRLQGLARVMPQFSLILAIGFFASLGLPGLNSFWSEFMVFVGAYGSPNLDMNRRLVLIPLISIVVTAAYYLYTMPRILFGDPPEDPLPAAMGAHLLRRPRRLGLPRRLLSAPVPRDDQRLHVRFVPVARRDLR